MQNDCAMLLASPLTAQWLRVYVHLGYAPMRMTTPAYMARHPQGFTERADRKRLFSCKSWS
jgi:hypothetical protein